MPKQLKGRAKNPNPPNHIAALRKQSGLSQQALAEKIYAHAITISRLETGLKPLTLEWANKIGKALGVDMRDLYLENTGERDFDIHWVYEEEIGIKEISESDWKNFDFQTDVYKFVRPSRNIVINLRSSASSFLSNGDLVYLDEQIDRDFDRHARRLSMIRFIERGSERVLFGKIIPSAQDGKFSFIDITGTLHEEVDIKELWPVKMVLVRPDSTYMNVQG